jgi:hypothetical protein
VTSMRGSPNTAAAGDPAAPSAFEEGRIAFQAGDLEGAHAAFRRAYRRGTGDPRISSWYGVTLVLVERNSNLGVQLCDQALRAGGPDPELLLNLARVHLALYQRDRVVQVVARGLELWPQDPGLQAARAALGYRREPVLPFLPRDHRLNVVLGRLRHRWRSRRGPVPELSPATLGAPAAPSPDARS